MILKWINKYRSNKQIKRHNIPTYCINILNILKKEHEVHYYVEESKKYTVDCYIIDGFLIKLNRISEIITLSEEDLSILIQSIEDLLVTLKETMINWGWNIT